MKKFSKIYKENLHYIGIRKLIVIIGLVLMNNTFPVISSYINKGITESFIDKMWIVGIGLIALQVVMWIVTAVLNSYDQNIRQIANTRSELHIKIAIRKKLCSFPVGFFETPQNLEMLNKANRNNSIVYGSFRNVIGLIILIPTVIAAIIPIIKIFPLVWIVLAVLCLINTIIAVKCSDVEYLQSVRSLESERKRTYYRSLFYNNETMKEIKAYNLKNWLLSKYQKISKTIFKKAFKISVRNGLLTLLADVGSMLVKVFVWIYVGIQTLNGYISIGDCILFIGLWDSAIGAIEDIRNNVLSLHRDKRDLKYLKEFMNYEIEESDKSRLSPIENIQFDNVSFSYPSNQDMNILKNINVSFIKGNCYLILGENGAGKSTLIKLILNHFKPTNGSIKINKEYLLNDIDSLKVGYMSQEDIHFSMSLKDNIVFGSEYCEEKFKTSLEKAKLQDLVDELPLKENTVLGKAYDDGRELSGGQWQRISFARLLYNENDIIILDEPTASLDPIAERNLYDEIKNIFSDKIVILISHRLSSVRIADQIVVMENGELKGIGNHSDLIADCKTYNKFMHT
ncbi:MAG: ABC transporter ATP-binding protein [Clostridia bacterium]|nr:ABC transporter ATP-binding protein [Clostridia bacterium]